MTDVMQRLLDAAGWDVGSVRHKQFCNALDATGLKIVPVMDVTPLRKRADRYLADNPADGRGTALLIGDLLLALDGVAPHAIPVKNGVTS